MKAKPPLGRVSIYPLSRFPSKIRVYKAVWRWKSGPFSSRTNAAQTDFGKVPQGRGGITAKCRRGLEVVCAFMVTVSCGLGVYAQEIDRPFSPIVQVAAGEMDASASDQTRNPIAVAPAPPPFLRQPSSITSESLDAVDPNAVGLVSLQAAGFTSEFWVDGDPAFTATLMSRLPNSPVPAVQDLVYRLVLAEAVPPGDLDGEAFLVTRIKALRQRGALDQAFALLERAEPVTPALVSEWLDIGLLTNRADAVCSAIVDRPTLAPDPMALGFCLARAGRWRAAWITVEVSHVLGDISSQDHNLMLHFLDPELFEDDLGAPALYAWDLTPLVFRLLEGIGAPQPSRGLPLEYAWSDLDAGIGWRAELAAAERLAKSGAQSANQVLSVYDSGQSTLSGAVWDRVRAVQSLDRALMDQNETDISAALMEAVQVMRKAELEPVLAKLFADRLQVHGFPDDPEAAAMSARLSMLSGHLPTNVPPDTDPRMTLAYDVMAKRPLAEAPWLRSDPLAWSILSVFNEPALALDHGQGQTLLAALTLLAPDAEADAQDVSNALGMIRASGQDASARWIAASLLLLDESRP